MAVRLRGMSSLSLFCWVVVRFMKTARGDVNINGVAAAAAARNGVLIAVIASSRHHRNNETT